MPIHKWGANLRGQGPLGNGSNIKLGDFPIREGSIPGLLFYPGMEWEGSWGFYIHFL